MGLVETARRDDGVAVVTLNDPDRRNAMSVAMSEQLERVFLELGSDDDLRAIVLTGAPPAFSGGGDLAMLESHGRRTREEDFDATEEMLTYYRRFLAVEEVPVPVVAAVNGHAIGAGLCVALACDLTVVAEDAKVGLNFAKLALHPGMGGSWTLPRRVGWQRGAELLYTGRLVTGTEATAHGIALEALPADRVLARAVDIAADIAASSPRVVRELKRSLTAARTNNLREQLAVEAAAQARSYGTDDFLEGMAAIRERRPPRFSGR